MMLRTRQPGMRLAADGPAAPAVRMSDDARHRPTILIIDDDEVFVELLSDALSSHFIVEWARDGQTALDAVRRQNPATLFLDHGLPDGRGASLIDELRIAGCDAPVVMLTASQDVHVAAEAMRAGAVDFIVKDIKSDFYEVIVPTATRAVEKWNNEKELEYLRLQEEEQVRQAKALNHQLREKNAQLRRAYQQIEASHQQLRKKNERLSELYETAHRFVDNVSHEMRTPLTVIKEFMSIVMDGLAGAVNEQQQEYLNIALSKTNDLARMVDDMLDISKIEAGLLRVDRTPCRAEEVLSQVTETLRQKARSAQVELKSEVAEGLPVLYCDQDKMARVLINLVVNAMKFTPEGQTIRLWARPSERADEILAGVSDRGPGIAQEDLQVIFERFKQVGEGRRSSTKGFGLGLNIVRELVNLNLGDVFIESKVGQGSRFWFNVPIYDYGHLLRRFLERRPTYDSHGDRLALVRAFAVNAPEGMSPHIKEFLAHHIAAFDLLFERPSCGDVILVALSSDAEGMARRLRAKNSEELRLSPGSTVDIDFEIVEQFSIEQETEKIAVRFLSLLEQTALEKADAD